MDRVRFLEDIGSDEFTFEAGKEYVYLDGEADTAVAELKDKILVRQPNSPKGKDWWCQFNKSDMGTRFYKVENNEEKKQIYQEQFCGKCMSVMEDLNYCCDDDYGIIKSFVYSNDGEVVGSLVYCPNCGDIKVNLN